MACIHRYYWSGDSTSPPEEGCRHCDHDEIECESCPDFLDVEVLKAEHYDRKTHEVIEG